MRGSRRAVARSMFGGETPTHYQPGGGSPTNFYGEDTEGQNFSASSAWVLRCCTLGLGMGVRVWPRRLVQPTSSVLAGTMCWVRVGCWLVLAGLPVAGSCVAVPWAGFGGRVLELALLQAHSGWLGCVLGAAPLGAGWGLLAGRLTSARGFGICPACPALPLPPFAFALRL